MAKVQTHVSRTVITF